jgi:predicted glycosyltransferase
MKIIFYCQYVWGMGHLFRSAEFVRALSDHEVTLVAGGQPVDMDWPDHVTLLPLPTLFMDEKFTTLIAGDAGYSVEEIQRQRIAILFDLFEAQSPDVFIVELYPFGRTAFGFELEPLLRSIREGKFGNVRSVCSLRDILVEKNDPRKYEKRVLNQLDGYFDLLLVHSDATLLPLDRTFNRIDQMPIPLYYTGFITQAGDKKNGENLRQELNLEAGHKLIVASAGGGRSGYKPLKSVLEAFGILSDQLPVRLQVFTGPFMDPEEFESLSKMSKPGIEVRRFTSRFLDYLFAADLSFSLAGYNTFMNLMVTKVPALVYPYHRQREQPMRVESLKKMLPMHMLYDSDLEPSALSRHMQQMLLTPPSYEPAALDLNGAENAARYLEGWIKENA